MNTKQLALILAPALLLVGCGVGGPAKVGHHAARVGDTHTFIGFAVADDRIAAYVCDGDEADVDTAVWLRGDVKDDAFVQEKDGIKLQLTREGDRLIGTIEGVPGTDGPVALDVWASDNENGLYIQEEGDDHIAWIHVDGEDRGALRNTSSNTLAVAPRRTGTVATFTYDRCCFWNSAANQYACQPAGGSCTGSYKLMRCNVDPPGSNYSGDCCSL